MSFVHPCVRKPAAAGGSLLSSLIEGVFQPHAKGFGFVVPDFPGTPDVFIPPLRHANALPGDRVRVRAAPLDARGRRSGKVVEVLTSELPSVLGRLTRSSSAWKVLPLETGWPEIAIPSASDTGHDMQEGDLVECRMTARPSSGQHPVGAIVRHWSSRWSADAVLAAASQRHGLPRSFSEASVHQASLLPDHVGDSDREGRLDLRDLPLMTIDGADSRDFDDAVWAERRPDGSFRLVVAVADVAHYVIEGSALDADARHRATSVYVPGAVIPMLPESVSNGLCSLNPHVDRLCMVCDTIVHADGTLGPASFHNAVMRSHARWTYDEAARWLETASAPSRPVEAALKDLHALYRVFAQARGERGVLEFEASDIRVILDDSGTAVAVCPVERNDAHRLIEECMIAANVQAARCLVAHGESGPFRVHAPPDERRFSEVRSFLEARGVVLPDRLDLTAHDLSSLLAETSSRPDAQAIAAVLFRMQGKAVYGVENQGHFGLGLDAYTHFTSPIRRYPDLLVHRAIKRTLSGHNGSDQGCNGALAQACSERERRAALVERETVDRHRCAWLASQVGRVFEGRVTGVTAFGAFVVLDGCQASGLLPVGALPGADHVCDPLSQTLSGSNHALALGDGVSVRLEEVNADRLRIGLGWVSASGGRAV